ncbi:hypothetical protein, partial [Vibrio breoganii]|uniref:hypothetical protein n=1 Tax=Vibrio breoganii TaxID=553239 RepID=UPI001A7E05BB
RNAVATLQYDVSKVRYLFIMSEITFDFAGLKFECTLARVHSQEHLNVCWYLNHKDLGFENF